MKTIGIDIGTTTISLTAVDCSDGTLLVSKTIPNDSFIRTGNDWESLQDADKIRTRVQTALDEILGTYPDIEGIGLTGQMHGIVYTDSYGRAVSPLYTWQDRRGELPGTAGQTLIEELKDVYGAEIPSGYGLLTHIYNVRNNIVPVSAVSLCTIADYIGMALTGRKTPLLHVGNAASLGLFDSEAGESGEFRRELLERMGIDTAILPQVTWDIAVLGTYRSIPVMTALGDNQAGFYGTVGEEEHVLLLNIGTGGQVSIMTDECAPIAEAEIRPYLNRKYLYVGASLCGGRAYAVLERFFREYAGSVLAESGMTKNAQGDTELMSQYAVMEKLAERAREAKAQRSQDERSPNEKMTADNPQTKSGLEVITTFNGTRADPLKRGSILNISENNFTPGNLICGVMKGMARELYEIYDAICREKGTTACKIIASGNGIRKNHVLKEICEEVFGQEICMAKHEEEAAYGAAVSGSLSHNISYI